MSSVNYSANYNSTVSCKHPLLYLDRGELLYINQTVPYLALSPPGLSVRGEQGGIQHRREGQIQTAVSEIQSRFSCPANNNNNNNNNITTTSYDYYCYYQRDGATESISPSDCRVPLLSLPSFLSFFFSLHPLDSARDINISARSSFRIRKQLGKRQARLSRLPPPIHPSIYSFQHMHPASLCLCLPHPPPYIYISITWCASQPRAEFFSLHPPLLSFSLCFFFLLFFSILPKFSLLLLLPFGGLFTRGNLLSSLLFCFVPPSRLLAVHSHSLTHSFASSLGARRDNTHTKGVSHSERGAQNTRAAVTQAKLAQ